MDTIGYWQALYLTLLQEVLVIRNDMARGMAELDAKYRLFERKDGVEMEPAAERAWVQYYILDDLCGRLKETIDANVSPTGMRLDTVCREMLGESRTAYRVYRLVPEDHQDSGRSRG